MKMDSNMQGQGDCLQRWVLLEMVTYLVLLKPSKAAAGFDQISKSAGVDEIGW